MKTFRLCSLTVYVEDINHATKHSIPLEAGLIINKEVKEDLWLIEGLIPKDLYQFFYDLKVKNEPMLVEASITSIENPPASFVAKVRDIKFLQEELQLLLDGTRLVRKDTYSETILKSLIEKGLSGEKLLNDFKRIKKERGPEFQSMIEKELKDLKTKDIGK